MKKIRAGFSLLVVVTILIIVISMVIPSTTSNVYAQDISTATPTVLVAAETAVPNTPVPVSYGTYDERVTNIVYSGSWVSQKVTGNYLNTEKYSNVIGSTAQFTFTGEIITIIYRGYPNVFGNVEVIIDDAYVGTINQTTSKQVLQKKWSSGTLSSGTHTVTLTHLTGTYISLDGFIVSKPQIVNPVEVNTIVPTNTNVPTDSNIVAPTLAPSQAVGYGTYDERTPEIVYTGSWVSQNVTGNYLNTEKYSTVKGSSASFTFTGESINVIYRGYPNVFGNMEVKIDGTYVGTINQTTSKQTFQNRWTSGNLSVGTHTLTLTHLTGTYVVLDGIVVKHSSTATPTTTPTKTLPPPVGYGTYDDRTPEIVYTGSWVAQNVTGNYLNTEKYSTVKGSSATFTFTGETINVIYRGYPNVFGNMEVKIDGTYVGTINQTTSKQTFQNRWTSGNLSVGTHTLTLTHLTGTYVVLDGIVVKHSSTATPTTTPTKTLPPPVGYGTYDDRANQYIAYSGGWLIQTVSGNYFDTEKYSNVIGSNARFSFTGGSISVIYRGYPNRFGTMEVRIDGNVVGTINQSTTSEQKQLQWTSTSLVDGTHILTLTHKTGINVSLDGLIVRRSSIATPVPTNTPNPSSTPVLPTTTLTTQPTSTTPTSTAFPTSIAPSITAIPASSTIFYVDGNIGADTNPGTISQPWKTIQKLVTTVKAGDTVYLRGGNYASISSGWKFTNSGTQSKPITIANYPGEQVVLLAQSGDMFVCAINPNNPISWNTPKADFVKVIGTNVSSKTLSNNVTSKKGIIVQGVVGAQGAGFSASDCDNWEIAGVDFVDVGYGIFTFKNNWGLPAEHSTDNWYVHDNRVYGFYRESGMQFNGDNNRIENNEIYKVTNRVDTPYGCQLLNILGDNNIIRGNTLSGKGSTAVCPGIMFEWDMADTNLVEQNLIYDVMVGIDIEGGDNNMIRNNIIYRLSSPGPFNAGIEIQSYDSTKTNWPCNEATGSAQALLPPNNPANPDYANYYSPRNCHSTGNQIYNNVIDGYTEGIRFYPLAGENTIIRNNAFSGWTRGWICFYNTNGTCKMLTSDIYESNNATANFGFVDIQNFNFHLAADSLLIDAGYDLGDLNPSNYEGNTRPLGVGYDIGAYETFALGR